MSLSAEGIKTISLDDYRFGGAGAGIRVAQGHVPGLARRGVAQKEVMWEKEACR